MAVKILIPYNFSVSDEKSIEFAGKTYAGKDDVHITLYHVHPPIPEIDNRNNPIMDKVMLSTSYLRQQQDEHKRVMEDAKLKLAGYKIPMDNIDCVYTPVQKDIADDIIRFWKKNDYDGVVLNKNPGSVLNYFSRSISKKILKHVSGSESVHIVN